MSYGVYPTNARDSTSGHTMDPAQCAISVPVRDSATPPYRKIFDCALLALGRALASIAKLRCDQRRDNSSSSVSRSDNINCCGCPDRGANRGSSSPQDTTTD